MLHLPAGYADRDPLNARDGQSPDPPAGIQFLGVDRMTGEHLWDSNSSCRTHTLIAGTTGSGKTEMQLGMAFNSLVWGSGYLYIDGKGDVALFGKAYAMARRMGRDHDLLILNYMIGSGKVMSNTTNPFAQGSAATLTQMIVSLMSDAGSDAMWKDRAISLISVHMAILCDLRDQDLLLLNVDVIRKLLPLDKLIDLYYERPILLPGKSGSCSPEDLTSVYLPRYNISPRHKDALMNYLVSIPGFNFAKAEKGDTQSNSTLDQHGFLFMQFSRIMQSLADTYSAIFSTPMGEVDFQDIVLNRRIALGLLPALENSEDEVANLGKIMVSQLKAMMGNTLISKHGIEGEYRDIIELRPTTNNSPYVVFFDEVGYYCVPGMDVMAAQGRSLGFALNFGIQDVPAMKKRSDKIADSIIANCTRKIFGKIEDPGATWEILLKSAGEGHLFEAANFSSDPTEMTINYMDRRDASYSRRSRVDINDVRQQREGEVHIIIGNKLIHAKMLYLAELDRMKPDLRYNRFLKVRSPQGGTAQAMEEQIQAVVSRFGSSQTRPGRDAEGNFLGLVDDEARIIAYFINTTKRAPDGRAVPIVYRTCAALIGVAEQGGEWYEPLLPPYQAEEPVAMAAPDDADGNDASPGPVADSSSESEPPWSEFQEQRAREQVDAEADRQLAVDAFYGDTTTMPVPEQPAGSDVLPLGTVAETESVKGGLSLIDQALPVSGQEANALDHVKSVLDYPEEPTLPVNAPGPHKALASLVATLDERVDREGADE
ncbi:type IV secretory system conjugative DNA transfer family protein [Telmatospirillum siberiense]|uniref:type IV secretory system conjugative DNA transfer family protein n=1 Tax=Telmatospirillum siberiense TaxID=382514 RepID=UPI00130465FD|nr:TraM recognition domain-containing protein [Telmatospirillum siberiense]